MLNKIKIPDIHLQRFVVIGLTLLCICVVSAFSYLKMLSTQQVRDISLSKAELYVTILHNVRDLYRSEVIARLDNTNDVALSHHYLNHDNTIPLPEAFSMLIGNNVQAPGIYTRLYSPLPFPNNRANKALRDDFARQAWAALTQDPSQRYVAFEKVNGVDSLRYASAEVMQQSCTECHNSLPNTPYSEWKKGELTGILEVVVPLDQTANAVDNIIKKTFILVLLTCLLLTVTIFIIVKRLIAARRVSNRVSKLNGQLKQQIRQDKALQEELLDISFSDALTGIANRRYFDQEFAKQWQWSLRKQRSLAVIMFDIDFFKAYNDNYGHPQGDIALRVVAQALKAAQLRPLDTVCRYGGEEFVLILSETDVAGAIVVAERMRQAVEDLAIPHQYSSVGPVLTVSAGVGSLVPQSDGSSDKILSQADKALYNAKEHGRNRVKSQTCERI